jgi:hypothetical protein
MINADLLGYLSVVIGAVAYGFYYRGVFSKTNPTRPHIFTWLSWTIAIGFAFFAQVKSGAGAGAWATGFTGINCAIVTVIALFRGEKNITWTDWVCFISSIVGIIYWRITSGLIIPVIIISLSDVVAFVPTYRKVYLKPDEDRTLPYLLNSFKFIISLFALGAFNIATVFYPATLILDNAFCAAIIFFRRRQKKSLR